jgi:hypothetical protein
MLDTIRRRRRRQTVSLDGRLSFTGSSGDALLVLEDDSLVLTPDPFAGSDGRTLDRLAELTTHGRFPDLAYAPPGDDRA